MNIFGPDMNNKYPQCACVDENGMLLVFETITSCKLDCFFSSLESFRKMKTWMDDIGGHRSNARGRREDIIIHMDVPFQFRL